MLLDRLLAFGFGWFLVSGAPAFLAGCDGSVCVCVRTVSCVGSFSNSESAYLSNESILFHKMGIKDRYCFILSLNYFTHTVLVVYLG